MSSNLSGLLLQSWGWKLPSDHEAKRFSTPDMDKVIVIISHTSYWDFVLLLMYRNADPRIKKNLYLVVKPQVFYHWGGFLRSIGCIPATKSESSGKGFVNETVDKFKGKNFRLIISPEGKMIANPWRSGYYHLARQMKASIVVAGLDYKKKCLYLGEIHPWKSFKHLDRDGFENKLKDEMSKIVPLYPECSYVNIPHIDHNIDHNITPVDTFPFIITIIIIILLIVVIIFIIYKLMKTSYINMMS